MNNTLNAIHILLEKDYCITLEDGRIIEFFFKPGYFFHLLGLHYLTDIPNISNAKNKAGIVKRMLKDQSTAKQIQQSSHFYKIQERVNTFYKVSEMLLSDKCEIIVDFDKTLLPSCKLLSDFLLYKTEDYNTYYILGLSPDGNGLYYPETYIVEHSKYYISKQKLLSCEIKHTEHTKNKGKVI